MTSPNPITQQLASRLRQCTCLPEYKLWQVLSKQFSYTFLRQQAIGGYVVDIFCPKMKLVIEIGGDVHDLKFDHDNRVTTFEKLGMTCLHFGNNEIKKELDEVVSRVSRRLSVSVERL